MKNDISPYVGVAAFLLVLALIGWWEYSVWTECRAFGHSWFYCFRMLGDK